MINFLPHEEKLFMMRKEILTRCEKCEKNKTGKKKFMACDNESPINYPFQECPERIKKTCISCGDEFDCPVIAYLWMNRCASCFKKARFVKGEGIK